MQFAARLPADKSAKGGRYDSIGMTIRIVLQVYAK